jgi:hypothetical protein
MPGALQAASEKDAQLVVVFSEKDARHCGRARLT